MSVTINYETEARIDLAYENEEGEECSFNCLEINIGHGRINSMLQELGVDHPFDGDVGERIDPLKIIEAIQNWDGSPLRQGMSAYTDPDMVYRLVTKIAMVATACHIKGVPFQYA